jgi:LmbE family N-acetylglucosaminyl deacetylase
MIRSLVREVEWRERLSWLPAWHPPPMPTLVIAPHPDDETLAAGGLIHCLRSQDIKVTIVAVTDGERAYPEEDTVAARRKLGEVREREQRCALEHLGVSEKDILRLRLPDSSVSEMEDKLFQRLLSKVSKETHLVAPWPHDFHPDHEACGRVAVRLAKETGARLTFWFFWTWHRGTTDILNGLGVRSFALTPEEMVAKSEALACHRSQLQHVSGEPVLPEDLLGPARRSFEVFLPA